MLTRMMSTSVRNALIEAKIQDDPNHNIFLIEFNKHLASVQYAKSGNTYNLIHSSIPDDLQGQGLGTILAEKVFDHLVATNKKIKITCEFLESYYQKNYVLFPEMDDTETDFKSRIHFYFRNSFHHAMLLACKEAIGKFKGEGPFRLYHALALFLNNRLEESINELEALQNENNVKLSSSIALMYSHKISGVTTKEIFQELDAKVREYRKTAEPLDFYYSGFVLQVFKKPEKGLDYIDKALNIQSDLADASVLKGWTLLKLRKVNKGIQELFEVPLKNNKRNLDAILGLSETFLIQGKFDEALDAINKAVVRFPNSLLPLIQKMRIEFALQDWEQTIETMNRIMRESPENLDAFKINILILLCRDANYEDALIDLRKFIKEIEIQEPRNGHLLYTCAQLFSRISGKNGGILKETYSMVEKALRVKSDEIDFVVELGYQSLLLGHYKEAQKYYKMATKIKDTHLPALMGLSLCQLQEDGNSEQIQKQVDFLLEFEEAQNSPILYFIRAKINDTSNEAMIFLKKSCDLQLNLLKQFYYGDAYLQILNPDFLLDVVKEYLLYISYSTDLNSKVRIASTAAVTAQNVLKVVTRACPGLYEATYLLAKLQFLSGDINNAMTVLEQILTKLDDEKSSDAYLLLAQMQVQNLYFERASQSLEMALSFNFKVRENPIYHYIRSLVDKNSNNLPEAVKSLTTALTLVSVVPQNNKDVTLIEKASIYTELIEAHNLAGQIDEASKLLETAVEEFRETPEEGRILILSADQAIQRENIQGAINLLNKVKPKESYYLQARTKLADILLKHELDSYAYLECYQEMVTENPSAESYLLLGDAYMNILEPDEALNCYNTALQQNAKDPFLLLKMGRALVESHYFARAVSFYKDAIRDTQNPDLKLDLAELYINMRECDKAELLLMDEIENEGRNVEDLVYLQHKTKIYMLLAQTREKGGNLSGALAVLKDAKDNQNRVRKRFLVEQTNVPQEETDLLIEIITKLAEVASILKNNEQAVQFHKEALEISPKNIDILTGLARLYMQMNVLEPCQQICSTILSLDPEDEQASVLMADIAFRKVDFDMAQFHFTQLVTKQPTNWTALVRLVEILRRTANLSDFQEYLSNAEKALSNPLKEAGYLYCKALYEWYSGNLNAALRNFNQARQDAEWGQQALYNMIEICLNPDDEMLGEQFMESEDIEYRDSRSMALKTADRLLKELRNRLDSSGEDLLRYKLLLKFRLLATQEKHNIERALDDFIALGSQNMYKEQVGPILGMATAYTFLKQTQRAKNQLKRVAKTPWTFEDAENLEKSWLLLADYYIQSSKYDVASELLSKVLQHNKSCNKAYEYLGYISEKEQRLKDAVANYENAWRFGGKTNPGIGYKLAYSLMKCKNYADAIDVSQQVLKLSPDYPKIRKDILDKSLNNLRI